MTIDLNDIRNTDLARRAAKRREKQRRAVERALNDCATYADLRRATEHGHTCPTCRAEFLCRRAVCTKAPSTAEVCGPCRRQRTGGK